MVKTWSTLYGYFSLIKTYGPTSWSHYCWKNRLDSAITIWTKETFFPIDDEGRSVKFMDRRLRNFSWLYDTAGYIGYVAWFSTFIAVRYGRCTRDAFNGQNLFDINLPYFASKVQLVRKGTVISHVKNHLIVHGYNFLFADQRKIVCLSRCELISFLVPSFFQQIH